jgi:DNA (cytosine-5)-methyltransferase 1
VSRPRLLDLFCGAGGAAMGYHRAGFDVVGVDINPQPHYPFEFHQADALEYHLRGFDAIHASPPCQAYTHKTSTWGRARRNEYIHPDLLDAVRCRLDLALVPYVIENVKGSPLRGQIMLCGTMFGLRIRKHRYFEANWSLPLPLMNCDHSNVYNPWSGAGRTAQQFRDAQDTQWIPLGGGDSRLSGVTGDLSNAIPPAYTEFIGRQLLQAIEEAA